jgi:hypothetical protein
MTRLVTRRFVLGPDGMLQVSESCADGLGGWASREDFMAGMRRRYREAGYKPEDYREIANGFETHARIAGEWYATQNTIESR